MVAHSTNMILTGKMAPYLSKLSTYDSKTAGLRQLSIQEVVSYCLNCIFQMQEIASKSTVQKFAKKREIIANLSCQPILQEIAKMIGGIDIERSILEELLDTIQIFFDAISQNPWL